MACIVGVQYTEGVNKAGMPFKGYRFYSTEELKKGEGLRTRDSVYMSAKDAESFVSQFSSLKDILGTEVEFLFNDYNRCVEIRPLEIA